MWKHLVNPTIAGFFFALGHFIIYFLSKTRYARSFESFFIDTSDHPTQYSETHSKKRAKPY